MIKLHQKVSTSSGFATIFAAVIILFGSALVYQVFTLQSMLNY